MDWIASGVEWCGEECVPLVEYSLERSFSILRDFQSRDPRASEKEKEREAPSDAIKGERHALLRPSYLLMVINLVGRQDGSGPAKSFLSFFPLKWLKSDDYNRLLPPSPSS